MYEGKMIPISIFSSLDYCEYQIYLSFVRGIKVKPTYAMKKGIERHADLEHDFLEMAEEIEEPLDKHIERMLRGEVDPFSMREVFVKNQTHYLHGYIDEISLYPETAIITDDKPNYRVSEGYKNQLAAYALSFKENFGWKQSIYLSLRDRDSQEVYWNQEFDKDFEKSMNNTINHLHCLLLGEKEFQSTDEARKCKACRFNKLCPKALDKPLFTYI